MHRYLLMACLATGLMTVAGTPARAEPNAGELAQRIEELKLQSVNLARDLWLLEQSPAAGRNQLVVFVSLDPRVQDQIRRIEIRLGDQPVAQHEYSASENEALHQGGAHRLFSENIEPGRHVLEARIDALGGTGRRQQTAKLSFRGGDAPKTIELRLETIGSGEPEWTVREWD